MKSVKIMLIAAGLATIALPGAVSAQAAPSIVTASPTATATAPESGQSPAVVTSTAAAPAAAAGATQPAAGDAKAKIPEFYPTPDPGIGQPTDKIALQPQFTEIGREAAWFHDDILVPVIFVISLLVLALLGWVVIRYNARRNPMPSRTSHNTVIEIIWTVAPILILALIAIPSIKLLAAQYATPKPDLTVKVIGHQWYWSYQYPDNGDFEVVSNILTDAQDKATGQPRQLGADNRMVVPVNSVIKIITTSDDVIHSFAVPAFWTKMDAVPGRLNETWFKVDRPGLYYGQCSELCGARHGYMPIAVEVVSKAQFAQWVAANGGTLPGAAKPASPDATANSPVSNPTATTAAPEPLAGASTTNTENASAAAKPAAQAATNN